MNPNSLVSIDELSKEQILQLFFDKVCNIIMYK